MFSFWGTVALAPRILLDRREEFARLRRSYLRFLGLGYVLIYGVAFTVSREARFGAVVTTVLLTFILLNGYYVRYLRVLRQLVRAPGGCRCWSPPRIRGGS